jgi:hypothetical protein
LGRPKKTGENAHAFSPRALGDLPSAERKVGEARHKAARCTPANVRARRSARCQGKESDMIPSKPTDTFPVPYRPARVLDGERLLGATVLSLILGIWITLAHHGLGETAAGQAPGARAESSTLDAAYLAPRAERR